MAAVIQMSASAPPQLVLATESGHATDIELEQAELGPSLSPRITDMISDAFPGLEDQGRGVILRASTTSSSSPAIESLATSSSSHSLLAASDPAQHALEFEAQYHISQADLENAESAETESPPPYHFQIQDSGDRIISRVAIEAIFPPDPLWSPLADGRPTRRPYKRFRYIASLWPTTTLSQFKDTLMAEVEHRMSASRRFRLQSAEVMRTWMYVESSDTKRTFLGFKRRKSKTIDVDESNWPTIVSALKDKSLVGELKMMYWREVPLTEAERQRQQVVAQMYRNTLRPYGVW